MTTRKPYQIISQSSATKDGITAAATIFVGEDGSLDCRVTIDAAAFERAEESFKRTSQQPASDARAT